MSYIPNVFGTVSTLNSTTTPLTASQVFTGTSEDVQRYASITVSTALTPSNASCTLSAQFSNDATNWDFVSTAPVTGSSSGTSFNFVPLARYFRVVCTNGPVVQSALRLQSTLSPSPRAVAGEGRMGDRIASGSAVAATRAVLHGPDGAPVAYDERFGSAERSLRVLARFNGDSTTDAFGRLRVSQVHSIFDSKQNFDEQPLYFVTASTAGGTITYQSGTASSIITTSTGSTSRALRQSRRFFDYRPGKSQQIVMTFTFIGGGTANVNKRVGYFDDNNGQFLMMSGSSVYAVCRTDTSGVVVEHAVSQSAWNIDKLDGTGKSGLTVDWTKSQIWSCDLQWLGVGTVRHGLSLNGSEHHYHEFIHANAETGVYMRTPNLPVRVEVANTQASAGGSAEMICASVMSEGGFEPVGRSTSVGNAGTGRATTQTPLALVAVRLKSTHNRATVFPRNVEVLTTTKDSTGFWRLMIATSLGGPGTWVDVENSALQVNTTATSVTGSTVLASGYLSTTTTLSSRELDNVITLASDYAGVSDILCLSIQNLAAASETYFGQITLTELT